LTAENPAPTEEARLLLHLRRLLAGLLLIASIAAAYGARDFLLPAVLAFFIAVTLRPFVRRMSRRGIPAWAATSAIVLVGVLLAVLVVAFAHHRIRGAAAPIGEWAVARRNRLVLAGLVMACGIVVPDGPDFLLYGLAVLLLVVPTSLTVRGIPVPPVDEHHLSERAALLTLIVMGEAFVKTALVVTSGAITGWDVLAIMTMFVVLFGLFAVYFDDVPKAGIRVGILFGELWMLAHLVLQLSIIGVAVGISKYLQIGEGEVPPYGVVVLMVSYVGIFVGLALIGEFDRRVPRGAMVGLHAGTAALALAGGLLTLAVEPITPGTYLLSLAALTIVNALVGERLRARTTVLPSGSTALVPEESS